MDVNTPEELSRTAQAAYQSGDYQLARRDFEAATHAFTAQGNELMAAEMANNLSVVLLQMDQPEAAFEAVEGTDEVFSAAGDGRRQALALGNAASALDALGRFEEAEGAYLQSADLLARLGEDQLHADVMQSLSRLQLRTGRQLQAVASMRAGLEGVKRPSLRQRVLKKLLQTPLNLFKRS